MIHARLNPSAVAHWGESYALIIEATSVMALIAPIQTTAQVQHQRERRGLGLARAALDRGDLPLDREAIGMKSSGDDLVIRCGECRVVRADKLIPFWLAPDSLMRKVAQLRARVAESIELERTLPPGVIRSTMTVGEIGSRGRRIGRAGLS